LKTKKNDPWQYAFLPKKRFRRFDNYKLKVDNDIVYGIQASFTTTDGTGEKELVNIVDILRKKYKARFSWPMIPMGERLTRQTARHAGFGDDYTLLLVEHRSVRKTLSTEESFILLLTYDFTRKSSDRASAARTNVEKSKKAKSDSQKYDGIDAL